MKNSFVISQKTELRTMTFSHTLSKGKEYLSLKQLFFQSFSSGISRTQDTSESTRNKKLNKSTFNLS